MMSPRGLDGYTSIRVRYEPVPQTPATRINETVGIFVERFKPQFTARDEYIAQDAFTSQDSILETSLTDAQTTHVAQSMFPAHERSRKVLKTLLNDVDHNSIHLKASHNVWTSKGKLKLPEFLQTPSPRPQARKKAKSPSPLTKSRTLSPSGPIPIKPNPSDCVPRARTPSEMPTSPTKSHLPTPPKAATAAPTAAAPETEDGEAVFKAAKVLEPRSAHPKAAAASAATAAAAATNAKPTHPRTTEGAPRRRRKRGDDLSIDGTAKLAMLSSSSPSPSPSPRSSLSAYATASTIGATMTTTNTNAQTLYLHRGSWYALEGDSDSDSAPPAWAEGVRVVGEEVTGKRRRRRGGRRES